MSDLVLREALRLHALGFAIHWIHPRSKEPVGSWSTPERRTLPELKQSYIPGMNIGTRLGRVSAINGRYLAVVDCDVKSADPNHLREMQAKFKELFPRLPSTTPVVASGRGNGSVHVYCATLEPVKGNRLGQSTESVRVLMPSIKKASEKEKKILTQKEIQDGWRLRPAWEISFMSEGRQVVLPPSIHPDSGKAYRWARLLRSAEDIPLVVQPVPAELERVDANVAPSGSPFKVVPVDLTAYNVTPRIIKMIDEGESDSGDRSTDLFLAAIALVKAGLSDEQILSCLTDRDRHLGQVAFAHAQTQNRARAAAWLQRYTLTKARSENDARVAFAREVEVSSLSEEENEATHTTVDQLNEWKARLETTGEGAAARPKITLKNIMLILQNAVCEEVFRKNLFTGGEEHGCETPWGGYKTSPITDGDLIAIKVWLARTFRIEPNVNLVNEAVTHIARSKAYHPVRDYLGGLKWDGVERIDTWLTDYLGAEGSPNYLRSVSRKTLCALVARVYEPGVKFDHVLILEGGQGVGKSTSLRNLVGDAWFSDAQINIGDKDAVLAMRTAWLVELGELSGMRRAEVDALKEFISRSTDRIRLPYGKRTEEFPRQCIFIGTTNRDEYLMDDTGNRRFWPVRVGQCRFTQLGRDRDQLFAEARIAYELGEALYLDHGDAAREATEAQADKMESDSLAEKVADFLEREQKNFPVDRFKMSQAFSEFGPFASLREDRANQIRAGKILRSLGYKKHVLREGGENTKVWVKG